MYNDEEVKQFADYLELANYLVTSNSVPTMLIFESFIYNETSINQNHITVQCEDEDWLMMYMHA